MGRAQRAGARPGHAILFGRSIAAVLPDDLDPRLALMVMDVCGAPALVRRVVRGTPWAGSWTITPPGRRKPSTIGTAPVCVLGGAGKSGSLSLAAARDAGAGRLIGVVPHEAEAATLERLRPRRRRRRRGCPSPLGLSEAVRAAGGPADVTVVCVDVPGCEQPAILATADGGTVVFFSMATSFAAAALGAEGLAADVTMLVGNGYVPGHADYALGLLRDNPAVRGLFEGGWLTRPRRKPARTLDPDRRRPGARSLARKAGRPIVKLPQKHTTVSVERATLRLAGLQGPDADGTPWVNRLVDAVRR